MNKNLKKKTRAKRAKTVFFFTFTYAICDPLVAVVVMAAHAEC